MSRTKATKTTTKALETTTKLIKKTSGKKLEKITQSYTKTELIKSLVERTTLPKKEIVSVLTELNNIFYAHIRKGGAGKFTLSGLFKATVKEVPARKARPGINPATGEEIMLKAKPASKKLKITALKALKDHLG